MDILHIIAPLVMVGLIGFISTKSGWLARTELNALSKFTFNLAIPGFLFLQMAQADIKSQFDLNVYGAFYLPVLACFALAFIANYCFHDKLKGNHSASAIYALGASYSNTFIVGLPVILVVLGEAFLAVLFMIVVFHSALLFALTSLLANKGQDQSLAQTLKKSLFTPLIGGIVLGAITNALLTVTQTQMPTLVVDTLTLLGKPAIGIALFALGGSMTYYQITKEKYFIGFATFLKLLCLPATVYFSATQLFGLSDDVVKVLVIMSACPTGVNAYLVAKNYAFHQETVAGSVVATTVMSAVTMSLWLVFLT